MIYSKYKLIFLSFQKKRLYSFIKIFTYLLYKFKNFLKLSPLFNVNGLFIPQPTHKLCVLKAPFVYKKNQEIFELKTYKYIYVLKFQTKKEEDYFNFFFEKIFNKIPYGINLKLKKNTYHLE